MKDQTTTIEQSCRLLELGVPAKAASMCWVKDPNEGEYSLCVHDEFCYEVAALEPVPAFTVGDLIEMLPKQIGNSHTEYFLNIGKGVSRKYHISYQYGSVNHQGKVTYNLKFRCKDGSGLIERLVETIEWLLSNGYKLKV